MIGDTNNLISVALVVSVFAEFYCFQRSSFDVPMVNIPVKKPGMPIFFISFFTKAFISSRVIFGWVNLPFSKQKLQYIVLFDPSVLVPPPFGSLFRGMPQL